MNFGTTYGTAPVVVVTPANLEAAHEWGYSVTQDNLAPYVTSTASGFTVTFFDYWGVGVCELNYMVIH